MAETESNGVGLTDSTKSALVRWIQTMVNEVERIKQHLENREQQTGDTLTKMLINDAAAAEKMSTIERDIKQLRDDFQKISDSVTQIRIQAAGIGAIVGLIVSLAVAFFSKKL
jgi:hypothetical protein